MRVPPTSDIIGSVINANHEVFITPIDSTRNPSTATGTEDLSLVKVYDEYTEETVISYWVPRNTNKTLASAVFRYYRQKFALAPWTTVKDPFTYWTRLRNTGDGYRSGRLIKHWDQISTFFNNQTSTGVLTKEQCVDTCDDGQNPSEAMIDRENRPFVFKLYLGGPPRPSSTQVTTLSRLDVMKQMFDAFINRVLAYNFQAHIGLVTFHTKASVALNVTQAVEDLRHKLSSMTADGDTAIWDSKFTVSDKSLDILNCCKIDTDTRT